MRHFTYFVNPPQFPNTNWCPTFLTHSHSTQCVCPSTVSDSPARPKDDRWFLLHPNCPEELPDTNFDSPARSALLISWKIQFYRRVTKNRCNYVSMPIEAESHTNGSHIRYVVDKQLWWIAGVITVKECVLFCFTHHQRRVIHLCRPLIKLDATSNRKKTSTNIKSPKKSH